jgi:caa(3)-type oxidase subunit IV
MADQHKTKVETHHHHILPVGTAVAIGGTLLLLTAITVWVAGIDLGKLNFIVAMVIATIKALLVMLFFMNLAYDHRENGVIFGTSFLFLAIFIVLTGTDLFFRGDVYVKHGVDVAVNPAAAQMPQVSKFKKPWISTPELIAHGKELFPQYCATCHGIEGKGNGIASAGLNPPPRNFTVGTGWKNGRKPSQVFMTLKNGIAGSAMASWTSIPVDDRWSLAAYVLSLGPAPETDSAADLAKVGVDPNKEGGGEAEKPSPSIPVDIAMELMAEQPTPVADNGARAHAIAVSDQDKPGARVYAASCLGCHGANAQGGVRVRNLGVNPPAWIVTQPLKGSAVASSDSFDRVVMSGLPGNLMPGFGQLSSNELHDLYQFVRMLSER